VNNEKYNVQAVRAAGHWDPVLARAYGGPVSDDALAPILDALAPILDEASETKALKTSCHRDAF